MQVLALRQPVEVLTGPLGEDMAHAEPARDWLRTPRLVLRPLQASDEKALIEAAWATPDLCDSLPLRLDRESWKSMFERQLRWCRAGDESGTAWRRVGVLNESAGRDAGRVVGTFNVNSIARGLCFEADVNWWVALPLRGRGYGLEAVRAMVAHAIADFPSGLNLSRLHAGIAPANASSRELALRAGFRRVEGRQSFLKVGARWERHEAFEFAAPISGR